MMSMVIGAVTIGIIGYGLYSSRKLSKEIDQLHEKMKQDEERIKRDRERIIEKANFNPISPELQERLDKIFETYLDREE